MGAALPVILIPGLAASARLYAEQIPTLWRHGPVMVADHTRDDSMAAISTRILSEAPPRFALAGLSMGGYISMEIMRQAPERVARLALLDTAARPDLPEQSERRRAQIVLAQSGRFAEVLDQQFQLLVAPSRRGDTRLQALVEQMAAEVGPEAFVRQQLAIIGRPDSRSSLPRIACPTLVLVGEADQLTPPQRAEEMAALIPGARLAVIAGSGHLSTLEAPEAVNAALEDWLDA